jgi:DEAD/DEAH box helicase domain-containing protein
MLFNGNRIEVIFDIETKELIGESTPIALEGMGISIVSAYKREIDKDMNEIKGEMRSFWESEFDQMWSWFEEADRIIGYNSLGFDNHVMNGKYKGDFHKFKHFDILKVIKDVFGHRIKLDSVAKESLGAGKNAAGTDAVIWWGKGDPESLANLKKYCEMDVEVTKGVYDYGIKNKKLKFKDHWNELREIEVDFSYPEEIVQKVPEIQMGLF